MAHKDQSYPFALGGLGASMAAVCTHPLDLTKVRMQTMPVAGSGVRPFMFAVLQTTVVESGIRSLYTGLSASLFRQMTYSMVRLSSYDRMKEWLARHGHTSSMELFTAAMAAGALGGLAGNPADIVLVRMTSDSVRPPDKRYNYSNVFHGLSELVKHEGLSGLTRGLGTNLTRAVLMNASQVFSYDYFKMKLLSFGPLPLAGYHFEDNLTCHFTASCLAGTVATTITSPADVLRSRVMSASGAHDPLDVLKQSLRDEGPRFLFKGWTPAFIRLGPNTVLMFVFYEQLKKVWRTMFPAYPSDR